MKTVCGLGFLNFPQMNRVAILFISLVLILGCKEKKTYDDSRFITFLDTELSIVPGKLLVIVLQNEECICTIENMNLAVDVFSSPRYDDYKKLLIVKSKNHKVLENTNLDKSSLQIFINDDAILEKYGIYFSTDRVFVYSESDFETYDMHVDSTDSIRDKLV